MCAKKKKEWRMKRQWLLTTTDNPFNPHTHWDEWYTEDLKLGHDTCGLLSRVGNQRGLYSYDNELIAMREIVSHNLSGVHVMVTNEMFDVLINPT